jgi:phenylpropionate dioxygenase-like ring-hydroxylating dioxygenase large terminal subunit
MSLPAWLYKDAGFLELERNHLFRKTWQLVCHASDVPNAGDYHTFEILGDRFVSIRGEDGVVRSFHNVCRHRAARLADGDRGNCGHRLVCPYHAWSYGLDGKLKSIPGWQGFEDVDLESHGLFPLEQEIWHGFVFVRLEAGLPSVAEMMAPYEAEIAPFNIAQMVPLGRVTWRPRPVNWKNIADNYADVLHIPVAHPGLTRLFAGSYAVESTAWVDKMSGTITEKPSSNWVERNYQKLLPVFDHLPAGARRTWSYYKLWPNVAIELHPDQIDFMQFIPISPTESLIRDIAYVRPDSRREAKLARYLNWRINRMVNAEDTVLIKRVQDGMMTSNYVSGPLAETETCLLAMAKRLRAAIPEAALDHPPGG